MDVRLPDGTVISNVPEGTTKAQLTEKLRANGYDISKLVGDEGVPTERGASDMRKEMIQQELGQLTAPLKGFSAGVGNVVFGGQRLLGEGLKYLGAESAGQALVEDAARRRAQEQATLAPVKEEFPMAAGAGEFAGEVVGTLPVGGALAAPFKGIAAAAPATARFATPIAEALATGGFKSTAASLPANIATRAVAGGTVGGLTSELIEPGTAGFGAAVGATLPVVGPVVAKAGAKGTGWLSDLVSGKLSDVKAGAIARATLGDELPAALQALKNAPPGLTATQALAEAGINADPFMALGELAKRNDVGNWYRLLGEAQRAAQKNQLALLAGGPTQTAARKASEEALNKLTETVVPKGKAALEAANVTRAAVLGQTADQLTSAVTPMNAPAMQKANAMLLKLKPIDADAIAGKIVGKLSDPDIGPSNLNEQVLTSVADKLRQWAAKGGGIIDADAISTIRKDAINEEIARLAGTMDPSAQSAYAVKLLTQVKPLIDDAIEAAGGKGWKEYLKAYETGMQGIAQQKMGATALKLFEKKSPSGFIELAEGQAPKTVEKVFGPGRYNLYTEMGAKSATIEDIGRQLSRDVQIAEQAKKGAGRLETIMAEQESLLRRVPNTLTKIGVFTNAALDAIDRKVSPAVRRKFTEGFKSGKNAVEMLESLSAVERSKVLKALTDSSRWGTTTSRAAAQTMTIPGEQLRVNQLSPETQNQNALAR